MKGTLQTGALTSLGALQLSQVYADTGSNDSHQCQQIFLKQTVQKFIYTTLYYSICNIMSTLFPSADIGN